ncbi:MAG: apolipoprotein N-acyltransferase [Candidatus Brevundimonas colombiensis]|uniref:Apolipoprotein N-acyltransferase n=1 Tax=Candidatus Brevundimonas colombiensis TaxID=3121376 RepID=A0AAJ5X1T1_9CAUL|nr:apolipoprotein N-acyltransferase [Brevundimonas sp.]WEK40602.1 MAG: apolipoprotein N-acyltransferase [Brevundimonas sp.]
MMIDALLDRFAAPIRALPDKKRTLIWRLVRIVLALVAGAGTAFAHPPFGVLIGLLGYPLLMILSERSDTVRGAFWMGWLAGFAYFFVGCWWVAEAFFVNPEQAWMAPFAASLLPAGLGLFWGAATALYRRFAPIGSVRVLLFAALFCAAEWLRGHVLTGFPWNPAGATWRAGGGMSQFASVVGVYGLSLVTVAAISAFAPLVGPGLKRDRLISAGLGALALISVGVFGAVRLAQSELQFTDTVVRLVQADVKQETKWSPETYRSIVDRYIRLTAQSTAKPGGRAPNVIVWPEGSLPASANDVFASQDARAIATAVRPGQTLLVGLARGQIDPTAPDGARYYNSLFALADQDGAGLRVAAVYDKHRLVPFGEYLPLGSVMTSIGLRSLVHMPSDFSAGPKPEPISIPGAPRAQILICYESLYPGFTPGAAGRPDWIVNASNDAWFGATSGPRQHLNLASYRAIETGLPIARATPTGISAMIDPWGRIVDGEKLEPGVMGVIDAALPRPTRITLYGRFGDWLLALMLLTAFTLSLAPSIRRSRFRPNQSEI